MSCSLNSLKGGYIGNYIGDCYRGIKGDTRSLDYGSYRGHPANLDHTNPTLESYDGFTGVLLGVGARVSCCNIVT